jgi:hypothetical protein
MELRITILIFEINIMLLFDVIGGCFGTFTKTHNFTTLNKAKHYKALYSLISII